MADRIVIDANPHAHNGLGMGQDLDPLDKKLADPGEALNAPTVDDYLACIPTRVPQGNAWSYMTRPTVERICSALRRGHTRATACKLAGIAHPTLSLWMSKGDTEDDTDTLRPYVALRCAVLLAESEAEDTSIRSVRDAGDKDWKAHAWWLSRRHSDAWAERSRMGESGTHGVTINVGIALPVGKEQPQAIEAQWVSVPELPE